MSTYRYPRTVAEMIPVREAEIAAHAHEVPSCHVHGPMEPRPLRSQTYEQMFCGVWYNCRDLRCGNSAWFTSRELAYDLGEPYYDGQRYYRHDGTGWAEITKAEADAIFERKAAVRDESYRQAAASARRKPKTSPVAS